MKGDLVRIAATDTFTDTSKLVSKVVKSFQERYGGQWDELMSQARLYFMEAFVKHTSEMGSFTNHVYHKVWWGLLNHWKREKLVSTRFQLGMALDHRPCPPRKSSINYLRGLFTSLSTDGREVVEMALDYAKPNFSPRQILIRLRKSLSEMGWSRSRMQSTFEEVRSAL